MSAAIGIKAIKPHRTAQGHRSAPRIAITFDYGMFSNIRARSIVRGVSFAEEVRRLLSAALSPAQTEETQ